MNTNIFYAQMDALIGDVWVASTDKGVCAVGLGVGQPEDIFGWLARHFDSGPPQENPGALSEALSQLRAYFSGERRAFDLPLDVRGTDFQRSVWEQVALIPYGETVSYGEIARRIGKPGGARAVGAAVGANPLPIIVPCHRVLGADGSLTGYGGGLEIKEALLRLEGIELF